MTRRKNGMTELAAEGSALMDTPPNGTPVDLPAVAETPIVAPPVNGTPPNGTAIPLPAGQLAEGEVPNEPRKPPVAKFGYNSARDTFVEVCVWQEDRQDEATGKWFRTFSLSVKRRYMKTPGTPATPAVWEDSKAFRPMDIPVLQHALAKAFNAVMELKSGNIFY